MRTFIISILVLITFVATAQIDKFNLTSTGVVQVPGMTAKEIYSAIKKDIATLYVSYDGVTKMEDPSSNVIMLEGAYKKDFFIMSGVGSVHYNIDLECRDGRYKYTIRDFTYHHYHYRTGNRRCQVINAKPCFAIPNKVWLEIRASALKELMELDKMSKTIFERTTLSNDDW